MTIFVCCGVPRCRNHSIHHNVHRHDVHSNARVQVKSSQDTLCKLNIKFIQLVNFFISVWVHLHLRFVTLLRLPLSLGSKMDSVPIFVIAIVIPIHLTEKKITNANAITGVNDMIYFFLLLTDPKIALEIKIDPYDVIYDVICFVLFFKHFGGHESFLWGH